MQDKKNPADERRDFYKELSKTLELNCQGRSSAWSEAYYCWRY